MINVSLENLYYIAMVLGVVGASYKFAYDLGYKHGSNAKK